MEEGSMALSLMLALLDVADVNGLAAARYADPNSLASKYDQLRGDPDKRRRVHAALYEAFYAILEGQKISYQVGAAGPASMAIGRGLGRYLSGDLAPLTQDENNNRDILKAVLHNFLENAINDNWP
jgi:hypothetical protein